MTVQSPKQNQADALISILECRSEFADIVPKIPDLHTIACELFPGAIEVEIESDPEISGCDYLIFNVIASGDTKEISARRREWHLRSAILLNGAASKVRLSISVVE
jgi:hypothetical protein